MTTALDYDGLATEYARHRQLHPGVLRGLVETAALSAASRVLEVGCGTGNYAVALTSSVGCAGWGIDPSPAMLKRANERAHGDRLVFRLGRAERLDVAPAACDLVYSVDVIHHVADRPAFFREAARVLVPNGRLCTVTDSESDIRRRLPLSAYFPETVAVELARYPSLGTLRAEMADAGFRDLAEHQVELIDDLTDAQAYRDRAFSSLHLISPAAFARGLARLEADIARGPIRARSLYTLLWGQTLP